MTGVRYYVSFLSDFGSQAVFFDRALVFRSFAYSAAVLCILGAHEMGHFVACLRYDVDATLPFFLPLPLVSVAGTLGAVIKIREAFPSRTALFDIGVAGPIAGFVVLVPVLFWGMSLSHVIRTPQEMAGALSFGEPLLFKLAAWWQFGPIPEGFQLNGHPFIFAAWFGMLATAFNLLPFGQLDGGHLTYATLGERSRHVSLATVAAAMVMCFVSSSWILMTVMMLAMLYFIGSRHPRVMDEYEPLGRGRVLLACLAIVIFILCVMPVPLAEIK